MGSLTRKAAIVGVAESDCGIVPDKTAMELMAQATKRALDDAGSDQKRYRCPLLYRSGGNAHCPAG